MAKQQEQIGDSYNKKKMLTNTVPRAVIFQYESRRWQSFIDIAYTNIYKNLIVPEKVYQKQDNNLCSQIHNDHIFVRIDCRV